MKQEALSIAAETADPSRRLNVLREYVQEFVLRSLHESGAFRSVAFIGGTALRFLHGLPRFSEDLDFSLHEMKLYRPKAWMDKLRRDLDYAGFQATVSWDDHRTLHVAWVRISEILREAGLQVMREQKLSVKLEIDSHPPAGARVSSTVVRRHLMSALLVYDLESMMAGKVHALWTRRYVKGRDWFDLVWYRSRRPPVEPNLDLLRASLQQTHPELAPRVAAWKTAIAGKARRLDQKRLQADVIPFLERAEDSGMMKPGVFEGLLRENGPI